MGAEGPVLVAPGDDEKDGRLGRDGNWIEELGEERETGSPQIRQQRLTFGGLK